jgi:nucleotide-binding universal stress UspA family protein
MKIVVGYDGSDGAKRALDKAIALAGSDGQLTVVAAAETHIRTGITEGGRLDPSEFEKRRNDLEEVKGILADRGVNGETVAAQGDPGAVILETAKDADLVVVGKRGLNPLQRLVLGSVSSKVIHRAECDVLVVH